MLSVYNNYYINIIGTYNLKDIICTKLKIKKYTFYITLYLLLYSLVININVYLSKIHNS